jgi:hypothetical protein
MEHLMMWGLAVLFVVAAIVAVRYLQHPHGSPALQAEYEEWDYQFYGTVVEPGNRTCVVQKLYTNSFCHVECEHPYQAYSLTLRIPENAAIPAQGILVEGNVSNCSSRCFGKFVGYTLRPRRGCVMSRVLEHLLQWGWAYLVLLPIALSLFYFVHDVPLEEARDACLDEAGRQRTLSQGYEYHGREWNAGNPATAFIVYNPVDRQEWKAAYATEELERCRNPESASPAGCRKFKQAEELMDGPE